jgi:hypothetical protein
VSCSGQLAQLGLASLGVTSTLALLRLLPMSDSSKDAEILALRHQITVQQQQLHGNKIRFTPTDRAFLAIATASTHPVRRHPRRHRDHGRYSPVSRFLA